ncbi:uncharacterized protein LOC114933039 [Nylanderia fulva]|uniref:uncharacterized protein LOC114933039 n=1 Tax=Nylanderia fulva TaxID=613905 RepID=UPI0010FB7C70|nr:uncharacterized protein LOC114933039 [Nylanderia fulva]
MSGARNTWALKYFTQINAKRAKCNICAKEITTFTFIKSNAKTHLRKVHNEEYRNITSENSPESSNIMAYSRRTWEWALEYYTEINDVQAQCNICNTNSFFLS